MVLTQPHGIMCHWEPMPTWSPEYNPCPVIPVQRGKVTVNVVASGGKEKPGPQNDPLPYPLSFSLPQLWRAWSVVCTHSLPSLLTRGCKTGDLAGPYGHTTSPTLPAPRSVSHLRMHLHGRRVRSKSPDRYVLPTLWNESPLSSFVHLLALDTHMGPAYTHTTRTGWETCLYKLPLKWSTQRPHVGRFCLHVMYTEEHRPPSYPQGRYLPEPLPVEGRRGSRISKVMQ